MPKVAERKAVIGRLHKQHAVLHTAAIDVKIMRLEKRQVTLSVFRQLQEQSIFDPDKEPARLVGTPWGRVQYLWKGCPDWANYHLVWQFENQLRRMPLPLSEDLCYRATLRICFGCCKFMNGSRCTICGCKTAQTDETYGKILFSYIGHSELWEASELENPKPRYIKECNSFIRYLEQFEKLDQLFIAV